MATILSFVPRQHSSRTPPPAGATGSIVFFTGVRYENPSLRQLPAPQADARLGERPPGIRPQ